MIQTVIELLNEARLIELEAVDQYMFHHYELESKGMDKLALKIKEIAIDEMKHAEKLAERILLLKGEPISKMSVTEKKGQEIPEILDTDIGIERRAIRLYTEALVIFDFEKDHKTKELFMELISDEDGHLKFFENIKNHLDKLNVEYLATLIGK